MANTSIAAAGMPFADFLRTWWYLPVTVWTDAFANFFHPQLFLGCNVEDASDEYHVLDEVGSYGKQLSQIVKATDVLIKYLPKQLPPEDALAVRQFREYEARVDAALAESRGPRPADLTAGYADRLGEALRAKRRESTPEEFSQLIAKLLLVAERSAGMSDADAAAFGRERAI